MKYKQDIYAWTKKEEANQRTTEIRNKAQAPVWSGGEFEIWIEDVERWITNHRGS